MNDDILDKNEVLLVASRGTEQQHGLWLWTERHDGWSGRQVDTVQQLSSLTGHPTLPVVYGTAGVEQGTLHAWHIDSTREECLGAISSGGIEPCDLTVDPSGRLLIATNYTTSSLALQKLDAKGAFQGPICQLPLSGGGPEIARQDAAHPHQAFFIGDTLIVIDLGADCVREFALDFTQSGLEIVKEIRVTPVPPGTGPRHGVILDDGRLAVSGELGENLIVGSLGGTASDWSDIRSTLKTGPAQTRWERNYPGDIRRANNGQHVYFANRSYNTLTTFDVTKATPELVSEIDTQVNWPQHIVVRAEAVLVAGWDSSRVVMMPLTTGIPQSVVPLFECAGAGWLHVHRIT